MIYPSHWSNGDFGLQAPDTEPYKTVNRYIQKKIVYQIHQVKISLFQDHGFKTFTASYLGAGNYIDYDAKAISEEVQALKDNGVNEFLLWNAGNDYTEGVNYNPKKGNAKEQDPEGVEQTKTKMINILIVKIMNKRIIKINNMETVSRVLIQYGNDLSCKTI